MLVGGRRTIAAGTSQVAKCDFLYARTSDASQVGTN